MSHLPEFRRRSLTDTFAWVDRWAVTRAIETVPLARAASRWLAERLVTETASPQRAIAAVDGYGVIAAGTVGASDYSPLAHRAVDGCGPLRVGEAVLLTSGQVMPAGADAVLDPSLVERRARSLEVAGTIAPGSGVIAAGEELVVGAAVREAGQRLRPQDLGMLALAGFESVPVVRRPRVRVLLAGGFQRDANGPMLAAACVRDGGVIIGPRTAADADTAASFLSSAAHDLCIVAGAAGQGANDFSVSALARVGTVDIYGVALNPGEHVALGRVGDRPVVVLPGRPLACLCAYDLIASRLIRRLAGDEATSPYQNVRLPLARKVASTIGRTEVCRVRVREGAADPLVIAESRLLATAVRADGFVLIPENSEGYPTGTEVTVCLYDPISAPQPED